MVTRGAVKLEAGGWTLEAQDLPSVLHLPVSDFEHDSRYLDPASSLQLRADASGTFRATVASARPRDHLPICASQGTAQPKATNSVTATMPTGRRNFGAATAGATMITVIAITITV